MPNTVVRLVVAAMLVAACSNDDARRHDGGGGAGGADAGAREAGGGHAGERDAAAGGAAGATDAASGGAAGSVPAECEPTGSPLRDGAWVLQAPPLPLATTEPEALCACAGGRRRFGIVGRKPGAAGDLFVCAGATSDAEPANAYALPAFASHDRAAFLVLRSSGTATAYGVALTVQESRYTFRCLDGRMTSVAYPLALGDVLCGFVVSRIDPLTLRHSEAGVDAPAVPLR